jgi:hypothetical protein
MTQEFLFHATGIAASRGRVANQTMRLPGPTFIVREPARLSLRIWERGLSGALTVVRIAQELIDSEEEGKRQAREPERRPQRGNGGPPVAERPRPASRPKSAARRRTTSAPAPKAAAPAPPPEPAHLDEEPELVAEVAEAGAEEGAGAELHVNEPWDGYDAMTAPEVSRRIEREGEAAAAAVKLYETAGRNRRSILEAADRALTR